MKSPIFYDLMQKHEKISYERKRSRGGNPMLHNERKCASPGHEIPTGQRMLLQKLSWYVEHLVAA